MTACPKCSYDAHALVARSWTFRIDRDPPSLNSRLYNAGPRRWAYKRERDTWTLEVRNMRLLRRLPIATTRRRVTLTRQFTGRQKLRDVDNLIGGAKIIVDALVLEGLLLGDAEIHAEIHYGQVQAAPAGLVVLIEEFEGSGAPHSRAGSGGAA